MAALNIGLDTVLVLLLGFTLLHGARLQRALRTLRGERAALGDAVAGLETGTRQAESGVEQLRLAADGAGRQMARQIERATVIQDDLRFLVDRSERIADRLEAVVKTTRGLEHRIEAEPADTQPRIRSQAERDLLRALQGAR